MQKFIQQALSGLVSYSPCGSEQPIPDSPYQPEPMISRNEEEKQLAQALNPDNSKKHRPGKIRERNRECILTAAEEEFAQHGFRGTTIQRIADRAELPKSNILYYFSNKTLIYSALFDSITERWNAMLSAIRPEDDPALTLARFIKAKVEMSRTHPLASKLFAIEVIQGAPVLKDHLRTSMRDWVRERSGVIQQWIDEGRMAQVDPVQLILLIWSSTQHYADFQTQILMIENKAEYTREDFDRAAEFLINVILRGCGLEVPEFSSIQLEQDFAADHPPD